MCVILPRVALFLKVITYTKTLEAKKAIKGQVLPTTQFSRNKHFSKINICIEN